MPNPTNRAITSYSLRRPTLTRVRGPEGTMCANAGLIAGYRVPASWRSGPDRVRASSLPDAW